MLAEVVLGIFTVVLLLWFLCRKPSGLPPGRWGLPLIGYIPTKNKYIDDHLLDFQKQYGDMYIWRIGTQVLLFVHDYHLARQIFNSQEFINRPDWQIFKGTEKAAQGVAFSNGATWHSNRRFTLRQLKDLGMGKSGLSGTVQTQALKLVEALKEESGVPNEIPPALNMAIVNVIWQMVASKQFEKDDPQFLKFKQLIEDFSSSAGALIIPDIFPWIRSILPHFLMRKLLRMDNFEEMFKRFMFYFHELIEEHREALDINDPKDIIDAYLVELHGKDNNSAEHRNERDLTYLIFDLFIGGSDTTINTLKWIFLYMAAYPDVQQRMQQEIDQAIPKETLAMMEDKVKLQYTEAVINEVLRKSALANTGLQHAAAQDTHLQGYKIPKGTICMASVESIHHDPRYWDKPDQFLPDRWLDAEGKLVFKKEGFMPFSVGKRNCIGESLARMELLIFTTAVFQSFSISPPVGKIIDLRHSPDNPLGHDPRKQNVVFTLREE